MTTNAARTHTLVFGLGQTGLSCIQFLQRQNQPIVVFDTRKKPTNMPSDIEQYTETLPEKVWDKISRVVMSPGVDPTTPILEPARQLKLPIISDIELFAQHAKAPIIGITGTNAKSTVTTLVTALINASGKTALVGGNIGIAALDLFDQPTPDYYVLELSSFQLEMTDHMHTKVSALLNFSANHLDRHLTLDAYWAAKSHIFNHCDYAVTHHNLKNRVQPLVKTLLTFGLTPDQHDTGVYYENGIIYYQNQPLLTQQDLSQSLFGQHNLENVLAALTIISPLKLPAESFKKMLQQFKGLPYRCCLSGEWNQIRWFNDSKSTTIGATIAAIKGIQPHGKHLILLLGGLSKGQDFHDLTATINESVDHVVVFGQDKQLIADAVSVKPTYLMDTVKDAVHFAQYLAKPGDQVLFSPACASLDQFEGYMHRGRVFDECVQRVNETPTTYSDKT